MLSTPLLLLPGLMCTERMWQAQLNDLRDICEPQVGDITGADTIAGIAQQVLAAAPPRFTLAGFSMGGIVAFELWRQAPERIIGLALLDTLARAEILERKAVRQRQMQRVGDSARQGQGIKGLEQVVVEELLPAYFAKANQTNRELADRVLEMALSLGPDVFIRQVNALIGRQDSNPTLATIDCPTLVLSGEEDMLSPADHQQMASAIANAEYQLIKNCGHMSTLEQPQAVNRALRSWLQRCLV